MAGEPYLPHAPLPRPWNFWNGMDAALMLGARLALLPVEMRSVGSRGRNRVTAGSCSRSQHYLLPLGKVARARAAAAVTWWRRFGT